MKLTDDEMRECWAEAKEPIIWKAWHPTIQLVIEANRSVIDPFMMRSWDSRRRFWIEEMQERWGDEE